MKVTNVTDLPDYLFEWLRQDEYDYEEGVLSATDLIYPVRRLILMQRHFDEIVLDCTDRISRRLGTAIHESFEKVPMPGIEKENRLYTEMSGQKLSGKYDMLKELPGDKYKLIDIKTTSVWTHIYGSHKWREQLSIYRYLCRANGYKVLEFADVCLVFTDWKRSEAKYNKDYPQYRVFVISINLMSYKETKEFIKGKLETYLAVKELPDDELPECTDEELWIKHKWAVMREGRKRAVKLFDSEEDAQAFIDEKGYRDNYIEFREGKPTACEYCDARSVCSQYDRMTISGSD